MPSTLKFGILLVAIYGLLVLLNAGFYAWWSADFSEFHRAIIRVAGVALIIYGLVNKTNWAWWLVILGAGSLLTLGGVAIIMVLSNDIFAGRPYPAIDRAILFLSLLVLALGFITFLLPSVRKEITETKKA